MSDMKRKDSRGRTLKGGESQRSDGRYQYQYVGLDKKRYSVYSWCLLPSDKTPSGKRSDKSLREKEKEIQKSLLEGENLFRGNVTLDEMFDIYNKYIKKSLIGKMKIQEIKKFHIVELYDSLQDKGLAYGTIIFYQKMLSAVFNMAIDEEFIDRNPTTRALDQIEGCSTEKQALIIKEQEALLKYARKYHPNMYRKLVKIVPDFVSFQQREET